MRQDCLNYDVCRLPVKMCKSSCKFLNVTCVLCEYFDVKINHCNKKNFETAHYNMACELFKKMR